MTSDVPVRIVGSRPATREEWVRVCRGCDYATFFHTPYWVDIFTGTNRRRMASASERVEFSDGTVAVIPLVYTNYMGNRMRLYWSMPAHTYGGWVSSMQLTEAHARAIVARLHAMPNLVWRENPYDPLLKGIELSCCREDFTQAIDLRYGFDAAKSRSDYAHRRAVQRALERGVSVIEAGDFDQWRKYFLLYKASLERWKEKRQLHNRSGYGLELFKAIFNCPVECRKLWLAQVNETPIAGVLCFYWNRHSVSWHGAGAGELFNKYRPNDLLYDHASRRAAENGFHWFDCNPSGGFKGVADFKEHIGATKMRTRLVNQRSGVLRTAEFLRGIVR
jgi:Acetyltransferase (GNAT) domain